ncbi:MAG: hypothetical protein ACRD0W_00140 [Acidimicrobiales bacterium]
MSRRLRPGERVHYFVWSWTGRSYQRVPRQATVRIVRRDTIRLFTEHDNVKIFTLPVGEVHRV